MTQVIMNPHRELENLVRKLAQEGVIEDLTLANDLITCINTHRDVEFKQESWLLGAFSLYLGIIKKIRYYDKIRIIKPV